MLIRLSLIIAIIAGLAAAGITFTKVKEGVTTTISARDEFHKQRDIEEKSKQTALKQLAATNTILKATATELASTKTERDSAVTKASEQEAKANVLVAEVAKQKTEKDNALAKLAAWDVLNITPAQVNQTIADLKKAQEQKLALAEEAKVLANNLGKTKARLNYYEDPENRPPVLPAGTKGSVVAVDPRYDFVILNIGEKQGILERGELIVNRNGIMIAKVKVTSVEANRCVASVIPQTRKPGADIMEGDQVVY
jgi:cell shape-determining protein MreC